MQASAQFCRLQGNLSILDIINFKFYDSNTTNLIVFIRFPGMILLSNIG
jgi:hypothetical protein